MVASASSHPLTLATKGAASGSGSFGVPTTLLLTSAIQIVLLILSMAIRSMPLPD